MRQVMSKEDYLKELDMLSQQYMRIMRMPIQFYGDSSMSVHRGYSQIGRRVSYSPLYKYYNYFSQMGIVVVGTKNIPDEGVVPFDLAFTGVRTM